MPAGALLINADDLGLWPSVDAGILHAWAQRAISGSTVFATVPRLPEVLRKAGDAGLPVGIHLNLTMGRPLSDAAEIPALVATNGAFMKRGQWTLPLPADQVARELRRQVEQVFDLGCSPTHLDSHHHIHRYPEVLPVVMALAQEFHLPVRSVDDEMRQVLRRAGIRTPDHFSMAFYGEQATLETLMQLVASCPDGTLEIMTHPGYATDDLPSSYREARAVELAVLTSPAWQAHLEERGIRLVGYAAI